MRSRKMEWKKTRTLEIGAALDCGLDIRGRLDVRGVGRQERDDADKLRLGDDRLE